LLWQLVFIKALLRITKHEPFSVSHPTPIGVTFSAKADALTNKVIAVINNIKLAMTPPWINRKTPTARDSWSVKQRKLFAVPFLVSC
jgi:hypothetical protein